MKKISLFLLLTLAALLSGADVFEITVKSTSRDGRAKKGETVTVTLSPTLN